MLSLNRIGRASTTLALTMSALTLGACGSSNTSTTTGSGSGGTSSSSGATTGSEGNATSSTASGGGSGGNIATCPGPGFGGGETPVAGGSVTATIVDQTGAAVPNQPVYICGIDICSNPGKTDASGKIVITTNLMMKKPAFKFGDALTYAELAIPLSTTAATNFMTVGTGKLPATGPALTAGTDAVSGGVTLSIPAGGSVGIDSIVYDTPQKQQLRIVNIPLASEAAVLAPITFSDGGPGFSLMYGLSPSETTVCPPAKVSVALPHDTMTPNNFGWAPGAAVEFWIMTIDVGQSYAPYAGWAKASDGVVSADGTSVATVDGAGFLFLETFAIRLKP